MAELVQVTRWPGRRELYESAGEFLRTNMRPGYGRGQSRAPSGTKPWNPYSRLERHRRCQCRWICREFGFLSRRSG